MNSETVRQEQIDGTTIVRVLVDGLEQSVDGCPGLVWLDPYGEVLAEGWFERGVAHRAGGLPAVVVYHHNGQVLLQKWFVHGVAPDGDKPNVVLYTPDGQVVVVSD